MKSKEEPQPDSIQAKPLIEEVFYAEESALLRFANGIVKRREVAEEVVQESFMKLHQHWGEVDLPRPWLYKAARNIALNHIRKFKKESLTEVEAIEASDRRPDKEMRRMEAVAMMQMLMAEMSEQDRELIRLKFEEEASYSKMSEKLEMGVGNVGYRLHHVLKQLADGLRKNGVERAE